MQIEKICINCMKEKAQKNGSCPHCGYNDQIYQYKSSHLRPMTILNGKYLLGRSIGQGGFGIVYIALDLSLDIVVAIKELFPENMMTRANDGYTQKLSVSYAAGYDCVDEIKRKFIQEARTIASVEGSTDGGVVQVKDLFEENGTAYMVMEYLDGRTMKAYLKEHGKLDFDTVADMMKPVLESLIKLHAAGIIHRDISPDNIMLLKSNRVKLLDFGDVKFTRPATHEGDIPVKSEMIQVKKGYTPLEQYQLEGNIGPWTDVYALCASIYQCITGIQLSEPLELQKTGIKKPSQMGIKIPVAAENALMKGLEIDYEKRIQDIQQLYDAFYPSENPSPSGRRVALFGILALVAFFTVGITFYLHNSTGTDVNLNEDEVAVGTVMEILDATYMIQLEQDDNVLLGVRGGYSDNSMDVQLTDYEEKNSNKFYLILGENGYYELAASHTNMYLAPDEDGIIRQYSNQTVEETERYQWLLLYGDADGVYILQNANGMCIGCVSGESGEQAVLVDYDPDNSLLYWKLIYTTKDSEEDDPLTEEQATTALGTVMEITAATYMIQLQDNDGILVGIRGGYSDNEMEAELLDYEERNSNKFYLLLGDNGYYALVASHTNKYLAPDEDGILRQYETATDEEYSDGRYQWSLLYGGDKGVYMIQNKNGQCLGSMTGESGEQAVLMDYDPENSLQYWKLVYTTKNTEEDDPLTEEQATTSIGDEVDITSATYMIQLQDNSEILLGVRGGYSDNEMDVDLLEYEEKNSNKFYVLLGENGMYALVAAHTNKYLAADAEGVLRQYTVAEGQEEARYQWRLLYGGEKGVYIIQNENGQCIGCLFGECGEQAVLVDYDPENNLQYWKLVYTKMDDTEEEPLAEAQATALIGSVYYAEAGTYIIQSNQDAGFVLGVEGDSLEDGAMIVVRDYEETNGNRFFLVLNDDGLYSIRASQTNMYVVPDEDGILRQYAGSEAEGFEWTLLYAGDGTYFIQHESGKCIGSSDSIWQSGAKIQLQNFNTENVSLYWKLIWSKKDE